MTRASVTRIPFAALYLRFFGINRDRCANLAPPVARGGREEPMMCGVLARFGGQTLTVLVVLSKVPRVTSGLPVSVR